MGPAEWHVSPYSGSWYPRGRSELESLIAELSEESRRRTGPWITPQPLAFIVPHAGLIYSGAIAAAAYRHISAAKPERVFLLGFSHRPGPQGILAPDVSVIETPLGPSLVDRDLVNALVRSGPFRSVGEDWVCDHSVEIQLPMLRSAAPEAVIVPLYVNRPRREERREAARILAEYVEHGSVFLASSDFTHFGANFGYTPFPVDELTRERLAALDQEVAEAAGSLDSGLFLDTVRSHSATVCGVDPIALLLDTLEAAEVDGEVFPYRHDYRTSGDLTGDFHHSVSYLTLGFYPHTSFQLDATAGRALLESALATLRRWQETGRREPVRPRAADPMLESPLGVFVSIYVRGELRGCIGSLGREPLGRAAPEMALAAALDDTRFAPLSPDESDFSLEISILTPMKRVRGREAVRVGEHGALLRRGYRQGLLLPQVATERNWDADTFLEALARKANLPPTVWQDPEARLYVFRAQRLHGGVES